LEFRLNLKEGREGEDLISTGMEFQTEGAEMLKAHLPNSVRHLRMARMNAECKWIQEGKGVRVMINEVTVGSKDPS